jgi:hypothetical protein
VSNATIPIIEAIRSKRRLVFEYHGGERIVEPHTYGLDKWQREILCAYQVDGASRSGAAQGWRTFIVGELSGLRVDAQHFAQPRPEYQRDDGAFKRILAQL